MTAAMPVIVALLSSIYIAGWCGAIDAISKAQPTRHPLINTLVAAVWPWWFIMCGVQKVLGQ